MIIISDDLTGAADCGIKFVEEGLSAEVILKTEYNTKADFKIFCTENRGKSLKEAKQVASEVAKTVMVSISLRKLFNTSWTYKR